jgi:hypothetical protein
MIRAFGSAESDRMLSCSKFPLCVLLIGLTPIASAQTLTGTTPADWPAGLTAPVAIPLPPGEWTTGSLLAIVQVEGATEVRRVAAQVERANRAAGTPARAWMMWAAGPIERGRRISVTFENGPSGQSVYQSRYADPVLTVTAANGASILSYHHGRPQVGQRYPLTGYIHPLVGLDGESLTVVSPQDHENHRGVFWAWVRYDRDARSRPNWWEATDIRLDPGAIQPNDGPLFSRFIAQHTWVAQSKETPPQAFLDELVTCRIFATTHAGRAVDLDLTLTSLVDNLRLGPTIEKEKGYGGLTFRFAQAGQQLIVADNKRIPRDGTQVRAAWADFSGIFMRLPGQPNKQRTGAAVFVDPHHPDFPPAWITRLYGVLNVSYPGQGRLELKKNQPLRLRYRIWIHRGDAAAGMVDAAYKAFAADWNWATPGTTQTAPER